MFIEGALARSMGGPASRKLMGPAGTGIMAGAAIIKAIETVPENHVGIRKRWKSATRPKDARFGSGERGDLYGILSPGKYWTTPIMSNISLVDLRDREVDLEDSIINRAGNDRRNNFVVSSSVTWGVSGDIEARHPYLFDSRASDPVEGIVAHTCLSGLRKTLSSPETETELLDDEDVLFHGIRSRCAAFLLDRYGVELRQFRLKGFNKHPNQIIGEALMSSLAASGVSLQLPLPAGNMNGNGHLQAETTPVQ